MRRIRLVQEVHEIKNKTQRNDFITHVLALYAHGGRHDLIWRKKITPYRILVSEIMLQQTQVVRVIPKFTMWMKKYPTLSVLRGATLQEILVLWQGLGYQRRAKALHTISRTLDKLPKTFDALLELPGIGTYTASALCAFAYNMFSHPVLETNIKTALIEHFYKHRTTIDDGVLYALLYELEGHTRVQKVGARIWYYALMDYGASLKVSHVSHNAKSKGYTKQSPYKGSPRELRAKILFSITHGNALPDDVRKKSVLDDLLQEGYIKKIRNVYRINNE